LDQLLSDFKILDDSEETNALLEDVKYLAKGILAFTSLRDKLVDNGECGEL